MRDATQHESPPRLVGVIGWPVAHSLSPAMHNAAIQALGLSWRYIAMPVPPGSVDDAMRGIRALGFQGVNVTVPHKTAVIASLDTVAPEAAALGAVNTVVVRRDEGGTASLHGYNTDVAGFTGALEASGYTPTSDGAALVVGAGGAARAVAYALLTAGLGKVRVLNRTLARAEALVADLLASGVGDGRLQAAVLSAESLPVLAQEVGLLVNATTVGMWPHTGASIWPEGVPIPEGLTVYDLVYNPLETRLLRQARRSGARGIDGLGMLSQQGALALALWLDAAVADGRVVDVPNISALMREVCMQQLNERRSFIAS
jgi:shikimate dehydrogenase